MASFDSDQYTDANADPQVMTDQLGVRHFVATYTTTAAQTETEDDTINLFTIPAGYVITQLQLEHLDMLDSGSTLSWTIGVTGDTAAFLTAVNSAIGTANMAVTNGRIAQAADEVCFITLGGTWTTLVASVKFSVYATAVRIETPND